MRPKKQTQTQTYRPDSQLTGAGRQALGIANRIATQGYTPYTGERVAALSENEQRGIRLASDSVGAYQPYHDQAEGALRRGTQQFTDANIQDYMNPYIESALDPAARKIREGGLRQRQSIKDRATSINAWGRRSGIRERDSYEAENEAVSDLYAQGLAAAYDRAVEIWGADRARDMQAAGRFMELGTAAQNAANTDIATLMTTGATDRHIRQMLADFDYQQFIENRDWDFRGLGAITGAIEAIRLAMPSEQTSETTTSGGELAQAIGLTATLIGAFYNPVGTGLRLAGDTVAEGGPGE